MENVYFEREICEYLNLPSIPKKEWNGEMPFAKGVAIVSFNYNGYGYAVVRFDPHKEQSPSVVKTFGSEPFFEIKKIFVVPEYMETDVDDADLDEESKKKAKELAQQADEAVSDGDVTEEEKEPENPYLFDNITNDEEAIAFISAYNQRNGIKGAIPKKHETILMRLSVIYSDTNKASGITCQGMKQSYEYYKIKSQIAVLKDVEEHYPTSTVGNVIQQLEARLKYIESY